MLRAILIGAALTTRSLSAQSPTPQTRPQGVAAVHHARSASDAAAGSPGRVRLHREIGTAVLLAGRYFDYGLWLHYAYRHAESAAAFREAARRDPRCVMCAVGEAIALGPTVDAAMSPAAERQAVAAVRRAEALLRDGIGSVSDGEWARAVAARYVGAPSSTRAERDSAYAKTMAALADSHPADADAQTLAAEAAMLLSPYRYWSADGSARPGTKVMLRRLTHALRTAPGHAGACHFFVHVMEAVASAAQCSPAWMASR